MQIQTISNQLYYQKYKSSPKNNNPNFKGELGDRVLQKLTPADDKDNTDISKVFKELGIGSMGVVSTRKVQDILESVLREKADYEERYKSQRQALETQRESFQKERQAFKTNKILKENNLNNIKCELNKKEKQLELQKQAFETEKQAHDKNLNLRQQELKKRNAQLDNREKELNKLEQKIIRDTRKNTTESIRQEEKDAAISALSEKYLEVAKQEAALAKKENDLINTENILKDSEVEKLLSDFRAYHGIDDPKVTSYDNFAEQMVNITQILNNQGNRLKGVSASTPTNLIKLLQDDDGVITQKKLQFMERILKTSKICDTQDLADAINIVINNSDNMDDFSKATHFISLLSLNNVSFVAAVKSFSEYYNLETDYDNIEDGKIRKVVNDLDEDQRSCGLNAYGFRPCIEEGVRLYNNFEKIKDLSLYSRTELEQAIESLRGLIETETHRKMAENFEKMINKIQKAIDSREQI